MSSVKRQILDHVPQDAFPLDKADLVARLEGAGADPELMAMVAAIDDDHFVDADELGYRLDDALGMPDADTTQSALTVDPDWPGTA